MKQNCLLIHFETVSLIFPLRSVDIKQTILARFCDPSYVGPMCLNSVSC